MSECVVEALGVLNEAKTINNVMNTVGAAVASLTGAEFSVEVAVAISVVLRAAEKKIKEITQSKQ